MIDLKVKLKVINLLKRTGEYEKWLEEGRTEEDMKEFYVIMGWHREA
tara:strand:+ start:9218 stop:9358 length:141 start_codon:yes stop_codon:yes gene_type:complete